MRIITGKARGVRLQTLEGLNTRPTSERSKEAVFSALQFDIADGVILDLFAGSGQMGLEAASRGARCVYLVDKSRDAYKIINKNIESTRLGNLCVAKNEDSISFLKSHRGEKFDMVFLDPPYATNLINEAVKVLLERDLLSPDAILVCESDRFDILDVEISKKCDIIKTMKHGVAHISVIKMKGAREV